ncbi:hypothetical protein ACLOJK_031561 [Asimina triloba]
MEESINGLCGPHTSIRNFVGSRARWPYKTTALLLLLLPATNQSTRHYSLPMAEETAQPQPQPQHHLTSSLLPVFRSLDCDGDGMVTADELCRALHRLGFEADADELETAVKSHIKPDNSGLEFDDFVALQESLGAGGQSSIFFDDGAAVDDDEAAAESDLSEAFKVFDEDGDGFISARELQSVLQKLGVPEGRDMDRVELMICSADSDRDGLVDFHEFKNLMQGVPIV